MITYKVFGKGLGNVKISIGETEPELRKLFESVGRLQNMTLRIKGTKGIEIISLKVREEEHTDATENG
jgi:hypothetical protein